QIKAAAGDAFTGQGGQRVGAGEDAVDDLAIGFGGKMRPDQRASAGDVSGGHGGAAVTLVITVGAVPAGEDIQAGRAQVNGRGTIIRPIGQSVGAGGGGDGDDVIEVVAGRVERVGVVVAGRVAAGGDKNQVRTAGAVDGVVEGLGVE